MNFLPSSSVDRTSPTRRAPAIAALLAAVTIAVVAGRAESQRHEVDYVRLVRVAPIAAPLLSSTEVADYVGRILATLDVCARTTPNRAIPFAGRARFVVTVSTTLASIEVLDVEPGLEDLRDRCLANAAPLPPLRVPSVATWRSGPGYARFALDVAIDARGFVPEPRGRRPVLTRVVLDSSSLTVHRGDSRLSNLQVRDEVFRGLQPYLEPLLACFADEASRDAYSGAPVRLDLRIERGGYVRSVELGGRFGLPTCGRRVLSGARFESWSSVDATELSISLAAN